MANAREEIDELVQQLERQRGELQMKMSLAKLEALVGRPSVQRRSRQQANRERQK